VEGAEEPLPAVIVLPGGGYITRAPYEGEPIARWLNTLGVSAFVVDYRVAPYKHPANLWDVQRAIRYVRHRATEWNVDPNRLGILGFSAGGHLASAAGTHFDAGNPEAADPVDRLSSRPDFMVLCYALISMCEFGHTGSLRNLLGDNPSEEMVRLLSNELQVTSDTPPAFIWHTTDDKSVPVEHALMFASSLSRNKVPFELHSYMTGIHGLGLAQDHPEACTWTDLCARWLRRLTLPRNERMALGRQAAGPFPRGIRRQVRVQLPACGVASHDGYQPHLKLAPNEAYKWESKRHGINPCAVLFLLQTRKKAYSKQIGWNICSDGISARMEYPLKMRGGGFIVTWAQEMSANVMGDREVVLF
jgi:acetyl esterase/lipase